MDNDLKSLSFLGIQDEKLSISKIDVNDVISYSYQITDDTTDIYQVTQSIDGSVVVDVTEGKLHDQIVNKQTVLFGSMVLITEQQHNVC